MILLTPRTILSVILLVVISALVVAFIFWLTTNITITMTSACYDTSITVNDTTYGKDNLIGILDTNGKGYIYRDFTLITNGETYNITYCIYNNTGQRIITNLSPNPYQCSKTTGVCK